MVEPDRILEIKEKPEIESSTITAVEPDLSIVDPKISVKPDLLIVDPKRSVVSVDLKSSLDLKNYDVLSYEKLDITFKLERLNVYVVIPKTLDCTEDSTRYELNVLKNYLDHLQRINKGFVNNFAIPVLDEFIVKLSLNLYNRKGYIKQALMFEPDFYQWILNLKLLAIIEYLHSMENRDIFESDEDLKADYKSLITKIYNKLHPLVQSKLQKGCVSVQLQTNVGFDTEFEIKDEVKNLNQLISIQIALNTRMVIKIPENSGFTIGYIHPLTSKITEHLKSEIYDNLILHIQEKIKRIRL